MNLFTKTRRVTRRLKGGDRPSGFGWQPGPHSISSLSKKEQEPYDYPLSLKGHPERIRRFDQAFGFWKQQEKLSARQMRQFAEQEVLEEHLPPAEQLQTRMLRRKRLNNELLGAPLGLNTLSILAFYAMSRRMQAEGHGIGIRHSFVLEDSLIDKRWGLMRTLFAENEDVMNTSGKTCVYRAGKWGVHYPIYGARWLYGKSTNWLPGIKPSRNSSSTVLQEKKGDKPPGCK